MSGCSATRGDTCLSQTHICWISCKVHSGVTGKKNNSQLSHGLNSLTLSVFHPHGRNWNRTHTMHCCTVVDHLHPQLDSREPHGGQQTSHPLHRTSLQAANLAERLVSSFFVLKIHLEECILPPQSFPALLARSSLQAKVFHQNRPNFLSHFSSGSSPLRFHCWFAHRSPCRRWQEPCLFLQKVMSVVQWRILGGSRHQNVIHTCFVPIS
mmetsp:Transcript_3039/g.11687  ORF Transcript_3039/g.11687 Transcript_3039/m.11687 type:complete len:210 (+) Transcript_3039:1368-1997(+)